MTGLAGLIVIVSAIVGLVRGFVRMLFVFIALGVACLGGFISGPTAPIVWSMYGDVADFAEYKFKRRMTGLVFSASMFAQKFGLTIGAGLSGWLLGYFGYVANAPQTEESLMGIRLLFTFIPAGIALLNVIALSFYNISDSEVADIEAELIARRAAPA